MSAAAHMPGTRSSWVAFTVEARRFALPLEAVVRVVRAAEITALPSAPEVVAGALDVRGRTLPVYDLRKRLRLPARAPRLSDHLLIARAAGREVVLAADSVLGLVEAPAQQVTGVRAEAVLVLPEGLALIPDLERFLSPEESRELDAALDRAEAARAD